MFSVTCPTTGEACDSACVDSKSCIDIAIPAFLKREPVRNTNPRDFYSDPEITLSMKYAAYEVEGELENDCC